MPTKIYVTAMLITEPFFRTFTTRECHLWEVFHKEPAAVPAV